MEDVFKALAEPIRRDLLDALLAEDGQTLGALSAPLKVSRQAVAKHLKTLEKAGLIVSTPRGRDRVHHLNPAPIREISARWFSRFERHRLVVLKAALEQGADDPV